MAKSGLEVVNVPVPADDIGIETQRSLRRILTLRVRIIVVHAEQLVARLMMTTARAAGMLNGDVRNPPLSALCYLLAALLCDACLYLCLCLCRCAALMTCAVLCRWLAVHFHWHYHLDVRY
jgi:hypothetical protein